MKRKSPPITKTAPKVPTRGARQTGSHVSNASLTAADDNRRNGSRSWASRRRAVLSTAVDDELIPRNPCRIKGASVERTPERPVLTLHESLALADAIDPRNRALLLLAVFGSLRWGELMGLTRLDLDLVGATVHVRRSVAEVGPRWSSRSRSPGGRRLGRSPGAKSSTPRRGPWTKIWRAAKAKAGIDGAVHFHDLRHTGNHLAAASGASTRELMGRMGHSSMRAALIYQHRTADRDRLIADALDSLIDASQRTRLGGPNGHEGEGTRS